MGISLTHWIDHGYKKRANKDQIELYGRKSRNKAGLKYWSNRKEEQQTENNSDQQRLYVAPTTVDK